MGGELEGLQSENIRLKELLEEHEATITKLIGHKTNEAKEQQRSKSLMDDVNDAQTMINDLKNKILDAEKLLSQTSSGRVLHFS